MSWTLIGVLAGLILGWVLFVQLRLRLRLRHNKRPEVQAELAAFHAAWENRHGPITSADEYPQQVVRRYLREHRRTGITPEDFLDHQV